MQIAMQILMEFVMCSNMPTLCRNMSDMCLTSGYMCRNTTAI